jgi:PPK2 family polyphosphate:nucleotide phosphotransferase
MIDKQQLKRMHAFVARHRVERGRGFRLKNHDPGDTGHLEDADKPEAQEWLQKGVAWLAEEQEKLYAQDRWAVLCVFQAMDAAGKDGTIKHVMSGVNPTGVQVTSFKQPSAEELDHTFLWRAHKAVPERGRIGIFNRSHYEDVLIARVHPAVLAAQKLPPELQGKKLWEQRYEDIRSFEQHLARNGVLVLKFFLHVSREEQRRRFLERLDESDKQWKFSSADVRERAYWDDYQRAYQDAIAATATPHAPWFIVPADNKWYMRLVVVAAIVDAIEALRLRYPETPPEERAQFAKLRAQLEAEGPKRKR